MKVDKTAKCVQRKEEWTQDRALWDAGEEWTGFRHRSSTSYPVAAIFEMRVSINMSPSRPQVHPHRSVPPYLGDGLHPGARHPDRTEHHPAESWCLSSTQRPLQHVSPPNHGWMSVCLFLSLPISRCPPPPG